MEKERMGFAEMFRGPDVFRPILNVLRQSVNGLCCWELGAGAASEVAEEEVVVDSVKSGVGTCYVSRQEAKERVALALEDSEPHCTALYWRPNVGRLLHWLLIMLLLSSVCAFLTDVVLRRSSEVIQTAEDYWSVPRTNGGVEASSQGERSRCRRCTNTGGRYPVTLCRNC